MGILGIISPGMTDSFMCSLINGELLLGARGWFSGTSGLNGKRFWDGLVMAARKRKKGMVEGCQSVVISHLPNFKGPVKPREVE